MVADHACCAGDDGIRASDGDCCSVTPGVAHAGVHVTTSLPTAFVAAPLPALVTRVLVGGVSSVEFASSPPLILRV
jgi:hypothetical protein